MPNWCMNSVVVYGKNKNEVEQFKERYTKAFKAQSENQHWGTFELFVANGYAENDILDRQEYIRGNLYECGNIKFDGEYFWLMVEFETAWSPLYDGIQQILMANYPSLRFVMIAEEPGCDVYLNTDTEHRFFTTKYCTYDDETGGEYFDTDEELVKYMKDNFGYDVEDVALLDDDDEFEIDDDEEHFVTFHRFTALY